MCCNQGLKCKTWSFAANPFSLENTMIEALDIDNSK